MRKSHRRLGDQLGRWLILAMRIRDIQAHPTGPRRADFEIKACPHLHHRFVEQENMADKFRHRLTQQEFIQRQAGLFSFVAGVLNITHANCFQEVLNMFPGLVRSRINVLIADSSRSVDAVYDYFRLMSTNDGHETRILIGILNFAEQIRE